MHRLRSIISVLLLTLPALAAGPGAPHPLPYPPKSYFSPQMYDPGCGTASHDCTDGLNRCIAAAYAGGQLYTACFLTPGKYIISKKVTYCAPMLGASASGSIIVAASAFSGAFMLDFYCAHGLQNYIQDLTFDMTQLGADRNVTAFGSSSPGGGGGQSLGRYTNLVVLSKSVNTFAVQAASTKAEPGMFTGSTWTNLSVSAPCNLSIGVNQDDGTMIGLRADITGACKHAGSGIDVSTNWKLIDSYVAIGASNGGAPVTCGSNTDFDGLFIEIAGISSTTDPWLVQYNSGALGPCKISRMNTNVAIRNAGPDAAMFRVNVPKAPNTSQGIVLGNFAVTSGSLPTPKLFSIFNADASPTNGPLAISINGIGWDRFAGNFAQMGSSGTTNSGKILKFSGSFGGHAGTFKATAPPPGRAPAWHNVSSGRDTSAERGAVTF